MKQHHRDAEFSLDPTEDSFTIEKVREYGIVRTAERTGITPARLSKWLDGDATLTIDQLVSLYESLVDLAIESIEEKYGDGAR